MTRFPTVPPDGCESLLGIRCAAATLFHTSQNTAGMFLPVEFAAAAGGREQNVLIVLIIAAAGAVRLAAGAKNLSRTAKRQVQDPT